MKIFRPVNQVRLTNVAVVRLKSHGIRFEVACFKNKILNYRDGVETNIDEVLQARTVFSNVSKGHIAKQDDIKKAFGTTDIDIVCKKILDKGELQVSEREREATLDNMVKDISGLVSERVTNPITGLPLTTTMIETSLKKIGFSVKMGQPPKKQALKAIEKLCNAFPDYIARAQMRIKILMKADYKEKIVSFIEDDCQGSIITSWDGNTATDKQTMGGKDNSGLKLSEQPPAESTLISIVALCDTIYYRKIDAILSAIGEYYQIQIISSNVHDLDGMHTS